MYYLIVFAVMPLISPMMFLSITIPAHMSKLHLRELFINMHWGN